MKVAVFSTKSYDKDYFDAYNKEFGFDFFYFENSLNRSSANLAKGFEAVCVFVNDVVDGPTVELLAKNKVQLIALRCAGFNNVDLKAADEHGIKVVRVPAYSPEAVAEHALTLILTLNRKTHKAYNRVREGNFSLKNLLGFNIHQKTVGVIGTGQIGATFCKLLRGFGCQILAYDIHENEAVKALGVSYVSLEKLFGSSDIISLHCPLNKHTRHLIDKAAIDSMKKGVMIINSSRGGLIKTVDVIEGLKSRQVGYLGIDVYEQEENVFFEDLSESIIQDEVLLKLLSFPNVLITSHQAFFTREAMDEITLTTLTNIRAFSRSENLVNEVK
jgi:D-lactate dehydrogenase